MDCLFALNDLPEVRAKRFKGPDAAMIWRMDGENVSLASASNAPRKESLQYGCPQGRYV